MAPTIDRADNNHSIFIDDADLLSVGIPAHTSHHRLVPVVDHLLVPRTLTKRHREVTTAKPFQRKPARFGFWCPAVTFVQHPYDDEPVLVAGGQLLVLLIPGDHLHCACTYLGRATVHCPSRLKSLQSAIAQSAYRCDRLESGSWTSYWEQRGL